MTMVEDGGSFYDWPPKPKAKTAPAPVAPPQAPPAPDTGVTAALRHSITITAPAPVFKKRSP